MTCRAREGVRGRTEFRKVFGFAFGPRAGSQVIRKQIACRYAVNVVAAEHHQKVARRTERRVQRTRRRCIALITQRIPNQFHGIEVPSASATEHVSDHTETLQTRCFDCCGCGWRSRCHAESRADARRRTYKSCRYVLPRSPPNRTKPSSFEPAGSAQTRKHANRSKCRVTGEEAAETVDALAKSCVMEWPRRPLGLTAL